MEIKEHKRTAEPHPFMDGEYVARCSCGWESATTYDTRIKALGAGDRHFAEAREREAWS